MGGLGHSSLRPICSWGLGKTLSTHLLVGSDQMVLCVVAL